MFESVREVARYLGEDVLKEEVVLIKSSNRNHLERLIYGQSESLTCWKEPCVKQMDCAMCEESGLGRSAVNTTSPARSA